MNTDKGRLWIIDETSDFDAGLAEVEQQAQWQLGCPEIIDALGIVSAVQYFGRFQLHHNVGLNEQINRILPHYYPFVVHYDPELLLNQQSRVAQFISQGVFINLLQKPEPSAFLTRNAHPMMRSETRLTPKSSVFISVHLWPKISCVAAPATGPAEAASLVVNVR